MVEETPNSTRNPHKERSSADRTMHDTRQGDKSKFESTSGMDDACVVLMIEMIGWMPRIR